MALNKTINTSVLNTAKKVANTAAKTANKAKSVATTKKTTTSGSNKTNTRVTNVARTVTKKTTSKPITTKKTTGSVSNIKSTVQTKAQRVASKTTNNNVNKYGGTSSSQTETINLSTNNKPTPQFKGVSSTNKIDINKNENKTTSPTTQSISQVAQKAKGAVYNVKATADVTVGVIDPKKATEVTNKAQTDKVYAKAIVKSTDRSVRNSNINGNSYSMVMYATFTSSYAKKDVNTAKTVDNLTIDTINDRTINGNSRAAIILANSTFNRLESNPNAPEAKQIQKSCINAIGNKYANGESYAANKAFDYTKKQAENDIDLYNQLNNRITTQFGNNNLRIGDNSLIATTELDYRSFEYILSESKKNMQVANDLNNAQFQRLEKRGYRKEDIERLKNGLSLQQLDEEIAKDPIRSKELEIATLLNAFVDNETEHRQAEANKQFIEQLDQNYENKTKYIVEALEKYGNLELDNSDSSKILMYLGYKESLVNPLVGQIYKNAQLNFYMNNGLEKTDALSIINGEKTAQQVFAEYETDPNKRRRLDECANLRNAGIKANSLKEASGSLTIEQGKIKKLEKETWELEGRKFYCAAKILQNNKNGMDFEQALETTVVAYKYKKDGIEIISFTDPNSSLKYDAHGRVINGTQIKCSGLTYKDLFGDDMVSALKDVSNLDKDGKQGVLNYLNLQYNNFSQKNAKQIQTNNNSLYNLKIENRNHEYYYNEVNEYINYKYTFIDPIMYLDDFNTYNKKNKNCSIEAINSIKSVNNSSKDGTQRNETRVNSKKDTVNLVSAIANGDMRATDGRLYYNNKQIYVSSFDNVMNHYLKYAPVMSNEQKQVLNYKINQEGYDAAYEYLNNIMPQVDKQWYQIQTKIDQNYATKNAAYAIFSSIGSVLRTPIDGISAFANTCTTKLRGDKLLRADVYSKGDVWRQAISQDIKEYWDDKNHEKVGSALSFMYDTGMSMADSALMIGVGAATGGLGFSGLATTGGRVALSAGLMGSRAYVSTLNGALDKGLSDGAAIATAFASSITEIAMESYSLGHLVNLEKNLGHGTIKAVDSLAKTLEKSGMKEQTAERFSKGLYMFFNQASQGFAEGEEEFATEIVNYTSDIFINQNKSDYAKSLMKYMVEDGMSEEEAFNATMKDFKKQVGQAFLGGFVSGICFGSVAGSKTIQNTSYAIANSMYSDLQGETAATKFTSALNINLQQLESYENIDEEVKKIINKNATQYEGMSKLEAFKQASQQLVQEGKITSNERNTYLNGTVELRAENLRKQQTKEKIKIMLERVRPDATKKKTRIQQIIDEIAEEIPDAGDDAIKEIVDSIVSSEILASETPQQTHEQRIQQATNDIEYAIKKQLGTYGESRQQVLARMKTLVEQGNYSEITNNGNARDNLKQYSLEELRDAYDKVLEKEQVHGDNIGSMLGTAQPQANIEPLSPEIQTPINDTNNFQPFIDSVPSPEPFDGIDIFTDSIPAPEPLSLDDINFETDFDFDNIVIPNPDIEQTNNEINDYTQPIEEETVSLQSIKDEILETDSLHSTIYKIATKTNREMRDELLKDKSVKNHLLKQILTTNDKHYDYPEVANILSASDIVNLLDNQEVLQNISDEEKEKITTFNFYIFQKNGENAWIEIINNDNVFKTLSKSSLSEITPCIHDYNLLLKVVNKFYENNYELSYYDYMHLTDKQTLTKLLNDPLYKYWQKLSKFDILNCIGKVEFSDEVITNPAFFDKLKSTNFVEFRYTINTIEKKQSAVYLEEMVMKWYDELITLYEQSKSDLTSEQISEIVVDGLFKDNIYNVQINIKEMLRYNSLLEENQKVLDKDTITLYEAILNIDGMPDKEKIELYNKLKDTDIGYKFYDDIRELKDLSYDQIQKDIVKLNEHKDIINQQLSDQTGVKVYDFRGKEFYALVRGLNEAINIQSPVNNKMDCYSLISSNNTKTILGREYLYGYSKFDKNMIIRTAETDAYTSGDLDANQTPFPNRIATSQQLVDSVAHHSEINIANVELENGEYQTLKPDYIVCKDTITEEAIKDSKRLGIPIMLINENRLTVNTNELGIRHKGLDEISEGNVDNYILSRSWDINERLEARLKNTKQYTEDDITKLNDAIDRLTEDETTTIDNKISEFGEKYIEFIQMVKKITGRTDEDLQSLYSFMNKVKSFQTVDNLIANINEFSDSELKQMIIADGPLLEELIKLPKVTEYILNNYTKKEIIKLVEKLPTNEFLKSQFLTSTDEELLEAGEYTIFKTFDKLDNSDKLTFINNHKSFFESQLNNIFYKSLSDDTYIIIIDTLCSYEFIKENSNKLSFLKPIVKNYIINKFHNDIYNDTQAEFIKFAKAIEDGILQRQFIENSPFYNELINSSEFMTLLKYIKDINYLKDLLQNKAIYDIVINNSYTFSEIIKKLDIETQKQYINVAKEKILESINSADKIYNYINGFSKELKNILLNDPQIVESLSFEDIIYLNSKYDGIYTSKIINLLNKEFNESTARVLFEPNIYKIMNQDTINRAALALSSFDYKKLIELGNKEAIKKVIDKTITIKYSNLGYNESIIAELYENTDEETKKKIVETIPIRTLINSIARKYNETMMNILINKISNNLDYQFTIDELNNISTFSPEAYEKIYKYLNKDFILLTFNYETVTKLGLEQDFVEAFRKTPEFINNMYTNYYKSTEINFLKLLSTPDDIKTFYDNLSIDTILINAETKNFSDLDKKIIMNKLNSELKSNEFKYYTSNKLKVVLKNYTIEEQLELLNSLNDNQKYYLILDGSIENKVARLELIKQMISDNNFRYKLSDFNLSNFKSFFDNLDIETINYIIDNANSDFIGFMLATTKRNDLNSKFKEMINQNGLILSNFDNTDAELIYGNLSDENRNLLDNIINNYISRLNNGIINNILNDSTTVQKSKFLNALNKGIFNEEKLQLLQNIKEKNIHVLSSINYEIFDDNIYSLGEKLITKLSKYYDMVSQIVELKKSPVKFNLFAKIVTNNTNESNIVTDQKMALLLNYLLKNNINSEILKASTFDEIQTVENIILKEIDQFSILDKFGNDINRQRSLITLEDYTLDNHNQKLYELCDSLFAKAQTIEEAKNIFFNKYFSTCIEDVLEIQRLYGQNFADVMKFDTNGIATTYLENMQNILSMTTMDEIKQAYYSFGNDSRYSVPETLTIINEIKQAYTKSMKEVLFNPEQITGYVEYEGRQIPIYEPHGNFKMLIQSTFTNYGGMPMINNNYYDSWNLSSRTENHGICCSMISNDNMGMAMVREHGVVIGFRNFSDEQMNMMAPYDIYTRNDGYLIKCQRPLLYLSGEEVSNQTRHTHNEFNLERTNLTGEGNLANIQPDYVVVFEEMSEEQKQNAYKASIEFNVPLVYINKTTLAIQESTKINNLITEFNQTKDISLLKEILTLHENNRSGYRVSNPELVKDYFPTEKIQNILQTAISNTTNVEQLLTIKQYIEEEVKKFDDTLEATDRKNDIDIDVSELLNQITNRIASIDISKIEYSPTLSDEIKFKLMVQNNMIYNENDIAIIYDYYSEFYNIDKLLKYPPLIFSKEYQFYLNTIYNILFTNPNLQSSKYENLINEINSNIKNNFNNVINTIIEQNIELTYDDFYILLDNISQLDKQAELYVDKYLEEHPDIDIINTKYMQNKGYRDDLPPNIKKLYHKKINLYFDSYLSMFSVNTYGTDQNSIGNHIRFTIKSLSWLTDKNDFINFLQNRLKLSIEHANGFVDKIMSTPYITSTEQSYILEYIYDKFYQENDFGIMDYIYNIFQPSFDSEFSRLGNKLISLGMTYQESFRTLCAMNSTGICSYGSVADSIFLAYKGKSEEFAKDFGFPMFININGNLQFNSAELLLDLYININSNLIKTSQDLTFKPLFIFDEYGQLHINNLVTENQRYAAGSYHSTELVDKYLKLKNPNKLYNVDFLYYGNDVPLTIEEMNAVKGYVMHCLNSNPNDNSIALGMNKISENQKDIRFIDEYGNIYQTMFNWSEESGHITCVTDILDDYIVVSTWGKKLYIPIVDLIDNNVYFEFRSINNNSNL